MPKRVLFSDSHGSVLLTRCWARGYHSNLMGGGSGKIWSRAAIIDVLGDIEFDRPHGLKIGDLRTSGLARHECLG